MLLQQINSHGRFVAGERQAAATAAPGNTGNASVLGGIGTREGEGRGLVCTGMDH